jgi:hypothetical protein
MMTATLTDSSMKQMLIGSIVIASIVAGITIFDLILGFPFNKASMLMDIMFLLSSGLIAFMAWDCFKTMR